VKADVWLEAGDGIGRLTLDRPDALNALNRELTTALEDALARLRQMSEIRVLIVAGKGRGFCAGNDLNEMADLSPADAEALANRQAILMDAFARLPQVTIAAVHGFALGGGCMLAAAQDLRVAAEDARFGLPEVSLGFAPAYGIARLCDVLGGAHARDLILTARIIEAPEALRLGLVTRVVPSGELADAANALAAEIAQHPAGGLAAAKRILRSVGGGAPGPAEAEAFGEALQAGAGARDRVRAFTERKRPAC
jgi:enoyl-CoA hydratase/carnithine racemase